MEFCKNEIHTSVLMQSKYSQFTVDDDFNIPDAKGDVEKIIAKDGHIVVEEIIPEDDKVKVNGTIFMRVLYRTGGDIPTLSVFSCDIPFQDMVSCDGLTMTSQLESHCQLEDLTVSMINSRKLEIRGLIGNHVNVYEESTVNGAVSLEQGDGIECQYKDVGCSLVAVAKRDVLKLREEIEIPQSKPNIQEILWQSVALRNMETKASDGKLLIRGEIEIFVLYKGTEERLPVQSLFSVRSLYREMECAGAREGMVLAVDYTLGKGEISIKEDADGEDRVLGCDYNVDMLIKLYEDCNYRLLADLYSPQAELIPEHETLVYENLMMRNCAKAKVTTRKQVGDDKTKLLQVCHTYGDVDLDDVEIRDNSVYVAGVVKCQAMYIATGEDPMSCVEVEIPFEYEADTVPLSQDDAVRIVPCLDQLQATLLNSEEVEFKAQVNLNISIFSKHETEVITGMRVEPIDEAKKAAQPGIVGYVVQKGDSIWSVARRYYATTASIVKLNNLESEVLQEGDRILIVKS